MALPEISLRTGSSALDSPATTEATTTSTNPAPIFKAKHRFIMAAPDVGNCRLSEPEVYIESVGAFSNTPDNTIARLGAASGRKRIYCHGYRFGRRFPLAFPVAFPFVFAARRLAGGVIGFSTTR